MDIIKTNYEQIINRIEDAAKRVDSDPKDIKIVGVTKNVSLDKIKKGVECGLTTLGENRIQEARKKVGVIDGVSWHFIGHLQRNKAKLAVQMFDLIESVDSLRLAKELNKRAAQIGKIQDVLIQVNTSGEESKYGIPPEEAISFSVEVSKFSSLRVKGLMTIGSLSGKKVTRECFKELYDIKCKLDKEASDTLSMDYLSMGMTGDFEMAIEEGANIVRIGTGIFGDRQY